MFQVKHNVRDDAPPRVWRELGSAMDRAEGRAGSEDVGEQALMRALPFFVWGCPCLGAGVEQMIGHIDPVGNSPDVTRPGGNVTGVNGRVAEPGAKRSGLLHELLPKRFASACSLIPACRDLKRTSP